MMPVNMKKGAVTPVADGIAQDIQHGWKASLNLGFTQRGDKTVLKSRSQSGPLAIQRPLYPDGQSCHVYILHPPGGVVGGDSLAITVSAGEDSDVLLTTPGATKFYRSENRYAKQTQTLYIKKGASLAWLPQENIFFPDAYSQLNTQIYLDSDALFWGWEMHCFGLPAQNEGFVHGHLVGKTEIYIDGQRVVTEGVNFHGEDKLFINNGLLGRSMMGTFYFTAQDDELLKLVQELLMSITTAKRSHSDKLPLLIGVTQIEGLMVVRALGDWSEDILQAFSQIWQLSRQYLGKDHVDAPRIWAT
ncbi:urease accessory protein UreD [Thaumasiovibrio sp. DFM-14]|uniref:urease accessory protein UreD n=1 Tax=Thaumasiovibrio sp. DFM-14 TaxID=3384792 RepID=UPI00399FB08B